MDRVVHSYKWIVWSISINGSHVSITYTVSHIYTYGSYDPFISAMWRIHIDPLEPFNDHSDIPATWPIHTRDMACSHVWCDAFKCMMWRIYTRDMTHSYMWPDSLMTHSCVWHDSFICVTWLVHMCDMTHSYVWHDSFIHATGFTHDSFICVTWLIHMCDMTRSHVWHDSFIHATGFTHHEWHISFICVTRLI